MAAVASSAFGLKVAGVILFFVGLLPGLILLFAHYRMSLPAKGEASVWWKGPPRRCYTEAM